MIIGLTGTIAAGKSVVVDFFKKKGFEHYVYSDVLREIAKSRNIEPTRQNLQNLGDEIKRKTNEGILSQKLMAKVKSQNAIVDGIRNLAELNTLKKKKNTVIIGIDASQKIRYQRLKSRNRDGDPQSFEEFKKIDNVENRGKNRGQEINKCLNAADHRLDNSGSVEDLNKKLAVVYQKITS